MFLTFSGGPLNDIVTLQLFNTGTIPGADSLGQINIESGETYVLDTVNVSESLILNIDSSNFSAFIGSNTFDFQCKSLVSNSQIGGGGNITVTQATKAACGAEVTYIYTKNENPDNPNEVPEPGSLALLGKV